MKNHFDDKAIWMSRVLLSLLIDACFMVFWVLIQHGLWLLLGWLVLQGSDQLFLLIFKYVFGISTAIPIFLYVCMDMVLFIMLCIERIKQGNA